MAEEKVEKFWVLGFIDYIFEDVLALPSPRRVLPPPPAELLEAAGVPTPAKLFDKAKQELEAAVKRKVPM